MLPKPLGRLALVSFALVVSIPTGRGFGVVHAQTPVCENPVAGGDILATQFGGAGVLYRVDPNGVEPPGPAISAAYDAIAYAPDGRLIGNRGAQILEIDLVACEETVLSENGPLANATDLIVVGNLLYGTDDSSGIRGVVEVDLESGAQRLVTSSAGLALGNLVKPGGIAAHENGKLYVVDQGGPSVGGSDGRIVEVDPSLAYDPGDPQANQTVIASGFSASLPDPGRVYTNDEMQDPLGITIDPGTGDLLVTDQGRVMRFGTDDGELTETLSLGLGLTLTYDIEIDANGNYVVSGADIYGTLNAVLRVTPEGSVTDLTPARGSITRPRCVAVVPATNATVLCGDADVSGAVAASDALAILQAAVGARTCALCVCDVDGSATISATDALIALNLAVGLPAEDKCPPCAEPSA
jgi:hypothetical protein